MREQEIRAYAGYLRNEIVLHEFRNLPVENLQHVRIDVIQLESSSKRVQVLRRERSEKLQTLFRSNVLVRLVEKNATELFRIELIRGIYRSDNDVLLS